ncbi:AsnC family protein [Halobacteriales archaeon QS_8_69_26]|nr:MAG: AsnC family protein [Halobacteriales archaeon QS_8_69_26]
MGHASEEGMDEIDRIILGILNENPRTPYSEIADRLAERGYEMSSQGIRYRVENLFEETSVFFTFRPDEANWHIVRMALSVTEEEDARDRVIDRLRELPFWFVGSGFGSFDIYAVSTVTGTGDIDDLLTDVRAIDGVSSVEYIIETDRAVDVEKYYPIEESNDRED